MKITCTVSGVDRIQRDIAKFRADVNNIPQKEFENYISKVLLDAQTLAPELTGQLRRSVNARRAGRMSVTFGATATTPGGFDYAPVQHENLMFRHAPGKEALYIEKPFMKHTAELIEKFKKVRYGK